LFKGKQTKMRQRLTKYTNVKKGGGGERERERERERKNLVNERKKRVNC
jgi:hypothetical protein